MDREDGDLLDREYDLLERCLLLRNRLQSDAKRHLHHGFIQRLLMLQAGRLHLVQHADPGDHTQRGSYVGTELSLHANAYYLNLRGALDNFAWCIQYQWSLLPGTNETTGARQSIALSHAKFLKAIAARHPGLAVCIQSRSPWMSDLATRRDPAAHRIPLQVPHTIFSEDDAIRFEAMDAQAAALKRQGKRASASALLHERTSLGQFHAVLMQSTHAGPSIVELHPQVRADHDCLLALSAEIVEYMERSVPAPA